MISSRVINSSFLSVAILTWLTMPLAMAEPFISSTQSDSFGAFNHSLDTIGETMRQNYDRSLLTASHRNMVEAQANQTDTWKVSDDSFNQSMSSMVLTGGSYNSNGSYGYGLGFGLGAWGINNRNSSGNQQITPDTWGSAGGSSSVSSW